LQRFLDFRCVTDISYRLATRVFRFVPVALVLMAVCASAPASATTVINRTVQDMTRVSALVISGVVVSTEPNQTAPGFPLATRVTISVDSVLKGFASGPTISFMIPGGVRNGKVLMIPGMPGFAAGEEVVVFLERTPRGWIPSSLGNGKYTVNTDQAGRRVVWRATDGMIRVAVDRSLTTDAATESDALGYDELMNMIQEGVDAPGAATVVGGAR